MRVFATAPAAPLQHSDVQCGLGCWQQKRFDFHLVSTYTTRSLLYYRAGPQDARQLKHVGLIASGSLRRQMIVLIYDPTAKVLVLW